MSGTTTKAERGKTQIEVSTETRRMLRLLAALTDQGIAEAAAEAISRRLAEVQQTGEQLSMEALTAYQGWIDGEAGPAYAGNRDVRDGFECGYLAGATRGIGERGIAVAYARTDLPETMAGLAGGVVLIVTDETAASFRDGERYEITYRGMP